jgi:predicted RNase H-like HicB family nuclease
MTDASKYPASVFWSEEDGGFVALAPDLPGCSAFGKTQGEALDELEDAILGWIEAAQAAGNPIPKPSRKPEPEYYSGKLVLRIPRSLHATLASAAKDDGVSLNQHLLHLLAAGSVQPAGRGGVTVVIVNPTISAQVKSTASGERPIIRPSEDKFASLQSAAKPH